MEWIGKWCDLVGAFCKQIKNNFRKFWNFVLNFEFKEFLWVFWTVFIDFSVKTEEILSHQKLWLKFAIVPTKAITLQPA